MRIKILLADDHQMLREGLRVLFTREPGMEVIGEAADGREAVEQVEQLAPDIVVMDLTMSELNGIEATRRIVKPGAKTKVVCLSGYSDATRIREMFKAGASAYVVKDGAFDELITAIRSVRKGHIYLSPVIAASVVKDYVIDTPTGHLTAFTALSDREREVLQAVAEGKSSKQIAHQLHVSTKTVETHRRNIMAKLQVDNVAGLTKLAIREGVVSL